MNNKAEQTVTSGNSELAYAWNFLADLGSSKQFSLTGAFPKGMSANDMNAEVDKIRAVFDRQQAKSAALAVSQEIDQLVLRYKNAIDDLARIDEKHDNKGGPTSQERAQREGATITIAGMAKDLEFKKGVLAKLQDEAK